MNNGVDSSLFGPLFGRVDETVREVQRLASIVQPKSALDYMRAAAEAFVSEAAQRPEGLSLDLTDAFKGLVLEAAARRCGGPRAVSEAFKMLGKTRAVEGRNELKTWAREAMRVEALLDAMNGVPQVGAAASEAAAAEHAALLEDSNQEASP